MKRQAVLFFFALALLLCPFGAQGIAAEKTYIMSGEITAIDTACKTVVIDVPLQKGVFTVAGPLAPDAVLKQDGQSARLSDFKVGEKVSVKWRSTADGHLIEALKSR